MARDKQFIIFTLKNEEFGIDIDQVREILKLRQIHSLPKAPGFVKGVINLRGHIITVIDLRKILAMEKTGYSGKSRIIMVKIKDIIAGLIVDSVLEILSISSELIKSPLEIASSQGQARCISNVSRVGERVIVILDVERILTHKDIGELVKVSRK